MNIFQVFMQYWNTVLAGVFKLKYHVIFLRQAISFTEHSDQVIPDPADPSLWSSCFLNKMKQNAEPHIIRFNFMLIFCMFLAV